MNALSKTQWIIIRYEYFKQDNCVETNAYYY